MLVYLKLVLKNHNCFVLFLIVILFFQSNFLWIFFCACITSLLIKCTRSRLGLFYVFLECTTYNLISQFFFLLCMIFFRELFFFRWNRHLVFLCVFNIILVNFLSIALLKFVVPSIEINVKNHNWSCWESGHEKPMNKKKELFW